MGFQLTVNGSNFAGNATVNFGTDVLMPTSSSPTQLVVNVPAADLVEEGNINVTVLNPGSTGGTSSPVTFTVNDAALSTTGATITATEGASVSGTLATFSDLDVAGTVTDYNSTIDWGDGTTEAGTVTTAAASKLPAVTPTQKRERKRSPSPSPMPAPAPRHTAAHRLPMPR